MIKGKTEEEIKNILILNKYLQNKHIVLIYIKDKNEMGDFPTVLDIKEAFSIKQKYAYTLLKYLERDRLIRKYDKIHNNGYKYATFKVTRKAKKQLNIILSFLNGKNLQEKKLKCS